MKFSNIVSGSTLLATIALAAPSDFLGRRHTVNSLPRDVAAGPTAFNDIWAGAVIEQPPTGTFTKVSGQFVLPKAFIPSGSQQGKEYAAAFWVGIGGSDLLQAGVDSIVSPEGKHEYSAWYEWFPEPSGTLTGLDLAAGDKIEVIIETGSPSSNGTMIIHNLTKDKKASKTLPAPSGPNHDDRSANWIVEDFVRLPVYPLLTDVLITFRPLMVATSPLLTSRR